MVLLYFTKTPLDVATSLREAVVLREGENLSLGSC